MTDNNNVPSLIDPINDIPSQDEIIEKPYHDDGSAPTIQSYNDNNNLPPLQNPSNNQSPYYDSNAPNDNQPQNQNLIINPPPSYPNNNTQLQYCNPDNQQHYYDPSPGTAQQINNGIQYNYEPQIVPPRSNQVKNPKLLICFAIILIIFFFVDISFLFSSDFNSLFLVDDIAILFIAIIYLCDACDFSVFDRKAIAALTVIVWFVGFGLRGLGITMYGDKDNIFSSLFRTAIRTIILFICIPFFCNQRQMNLSYY